MTVRGTTCDANGGTIYFVASGAASGPFPGTFQETGVVVLGPPNPLRPGRRSVTGFSAQFDVNSPLGTVSGTKSVGGPEDLGPFGTFDFPHEGQCLDAPFTAYQFTAGVRYSAQITTPLGTSVDTGIGRASGAENRFIAPTTFFSEEFLSRSASGPATLTLTPSAATNPVGTQHTVTATVSDSSGASVSGVTVRFTVTGSVSTSGSCTTNLSGQCSFTYQGPELPGADAITAFADTDNDGTQDAGEPSGAATKVWTLPTSTPLCDAKVTDGGRIRANNGDRATFGGNAQSDGAGNVKGQQEYQDHGPAQPQNVKSIEILALTCNEDRTQATIFGTATIDGSGSHQFRIDVQDLGEPGKGIDTYRIFLDTGYDSGVHTLESGNIQILK